MGAGLGQGFILQRQMQTKTGFANALIDTKTRLFVVSALDILLG